MENSVSGSISHCRPKMTLKKNGKSQETLVFLT